MFANSDGNTTAGNLSPASWSQESAQQVHDNEGIVGNVVLLTVATALLLVAILTTPLYMMYTTPLLMNTTVLCRTVQKSSPIIWMGCCQMNRLLLFQG